jgi:hypothetical protein
MQYVPLPQKLGLAGWWEKDDDRTTPPPLPIDVMLKAGWMVQKSHNSIPGVFVSHTLAVCVCGRLCGSYFASTLIPGVF